MLMKCCESCIIPSLSNKWPTRRHFTHSKLETVAQRFYQHIHFATRGDNILDLFYTNIRDSHKVIPCPYLEQSDHLLPTYSPLMKRSRPVQRTIRGWPERATSALQDCLRVQTGTCPWKLPPMTSIFV